MEIENAKTDIRSTLRELFITGAKVVAVLSSFIIRGSFKRS